MASLRPSLASSASTPLCWAASLDPVLVWAPNSKPWAGAPGPDRAVSAPARPGAGATTAVTVPTIRRAATSATTPTRRTEVRSRDARAGTIPGTSGRRAATACPTGRDHSPWYIRPDSGGPCPSAPLVPGRSGRGFGAGDAGRPDGGGVAGARFELEDVAGDEAHVAGIGVEDDAPGQAHQRLVVGVVVPPVGVARPVRPGVELQAPGLEPDPHLVGSPAGSGVQLGGHGGRA